MPRLRDFPPVVEEHDRVKLTIKQGRAVDLYVGERLPMREVAVHMGVSQEAIRKLLDKALRRINGMIRPSGYPMDIDAIDDSKIIGAA